VSDAVLGLGPFRQVLQPALHPGLRTRGGREFVERNVVVVFVDLSAEGNQGVLPEQVQQKFRAELPPVVLAETRKGKVGEEGIDLRFVLQELFAAGHPAQGPGHLAGDAQAGETLGQGPLRLRPQEGQHPVGVKAAALEVGLLRGPEDQLPARDGGVTVHSGVLEVSPDGLGRVGIGDVDHPLAALQALEEEGGDQRTVFLLGLIEPAGVGGWREGGGGSSQSLGFVHRLSFYLYLRARPFPPAMFGWGGEKKGFYYIPGWDISKYNATL